MQDIPQETHHETTRLTQSALVVLWEIDLTEVGGERYFFCNEQNEKGEPVTWQGRQYQAYPIQGTGFELNGKGSAARPTLTVSNLHGMVTGMAEDLQSLVGGTVVRRKVYARFLDAVNFVNGNSDADPEQEVISRWRIEQCSELSAVSASFVLSTPTETDGAVFPGRIMLANTCTWTYRGDECGYHGPAVADEYDQPTSDITKDKCSKCLSGCKFRNNVGNFGGFLCVPHLTGRRFEHGVTDCYTLFRDAYHLAGIEMPDFHREDDWWCNGQNLYLDNLEATGLYQVPLSAAQPGDVLLCCFGSSVPNHAAIYCGDGELLHHIPEQLSKRERYTDKWQRRTHSLWRHRAWHASAFTGIYNDLAAASTFV
ncbi:TPA: phage minor tail protein L [Escherichia coli]|nr:phage minor tail protein L [Escherichia coli]HAY0569845.1 phage minor tail protein L [Escherichia coli]